MSNVMIDEVSDHSEAERPDAAALAIGHQVVDTKAPGAQSQATDTYYPQREAGDHINRFQLCALVSESAKRIKASADRAGEPLPLAAVVRAVLRCYRLAAEDKRGPWSGEELDSTALQGLDQKILKAVITHQYGDRVKNSEVRLSQARQLGDDTKIKAEKEGLERAIESRDRRLRVSA